MHKRYLGDGVYVEIEYGFGIILTTSDGMRDTNKIMLEPEVIKGLAEYLQEIKDDKLKIGE